MRDILEKDAAITNWRRENLVSCYRNRHYQYILPKSVDGIFSVYCIGFGIEDGHINFSKPVKGALCYLVEDKRGLPEIKRRIAESKAIGRNTPNFEYWIYSKGKDGFDHGKKVA